MLCIKSLFVSLIYTVFNLVDRNNSQDGQSVVSSSSSSSSSESSSSSSLLLLTKTTLGFVDGCLAEEVFGKGEAKEDAEDRKER